MKQIFEHIITSKLHLLSLLLVAVLFTPTIISISTIYSNPDEVYALMENPIGEEEERESEKDEKEKEIEEFALSNHLSNNSILSLNFKNHLFENGFYSSITTDIVIPPPDYILV